MKIRTEIILWLLGITLVALGHFNGLVVAPPEAMMGDVGRILYVHVPTAWVGLTIYLVAFIAAIGSLWTSKLGWDALVEATVEVGVVLNGLLLLQGSIWAKPTWGVYWTWDPRLTTSAVMVVAFGGILVLRSMIDQPSRRMTLSAVATIVAFVNVPITYMSVKWWRTLHQNFSSPDTVSSTMITPLRVAAFGMLFLAIALVIRRWRIANGRLQAEAAASDMPAVPTPLDLGAQV
jgi:heme exporter protein C